MLDGGSDALDAAPATWGHRVSHCLGYTLGFMGWPFACALEFSVVSPGASGAPTRMQREMPGKTLTRLRHLICQMATWPPKEEGSLSKR